MNLLVFTLNNFLDLIFLSLVAKSNFYLSKNVSVLVQKVALTHRLTLRL